jgi:hypothetical protein
MQHRLDSDIPHNPFYGCFHSPANFNHIRFCVGKQLQYMKDLNPIEDGTAARSYKILLCEFYFGSR